MWLLFFVCSQVHKELGLSLSPEIADEMLFDADINGTGVDYCSLIRCVCLSLVVCVCMHERTM